MASPAVTTVPQPIRAEFLFSGSVPRRQTLHVEAASAGPVAFHQPPVRDLHAFGTVPTVPVNLQSIRDSEATHQIPLSVYMIVWDLGVSGKYPSSTISVRFCSTGRNKNHCMESEVAALSLSDDHHPARETQVISSRKQ